MKKIITILSTFMLVLSLSACTSNEKEPNTPNEELTQNIAEDSTFKASIKPLKLSEEADKVFKLLSDDHTQLYDLDIQNGEDKTVSISLYLYKDNKWEKSTIAQCTKYINDFGIQITKTMTMNSETEHYDNFYLNYFEFDEHLNKKSSSQMQFQYDGFVNSVGTSSSFLQEETEIAANQELIIYSTFGSKDEGNEEIISVPDNPNIDSLLNNNEEYLYEGGILITLSIADK